ncbi:fibronectin type III domain-containing protein [Paludibaculum fermentans]|uniref:Fibronectin type-III domain-containing protein n=1 Tax=Paludibaculum fermentans TaxID=1473598 RepID=A0A7S7SJA4_PALFE|nr:hypothetical protein [Paludibaculum fermentans]QOY87009.1 hypothetical protein IRI77_30215 [Paludibaculum fermentans]
MTQRTPFVLLVFGAIALAQAPPTGLTVVEATKSAVSLKWAAGDDTATSYVVERKPLNGEYGPALTILESTGRDTVIDSYATYVYRVRAVKDQNLSDPSNEVTVGPPPVGLQVIVPEPEDGSASYVGRSLAQAFDANGDPALAYLIDDPNQDGDYSDSTLWFLSWNRALYKWNDAVQVAVVGIVSGAAHSIPPISLAHDDSDNTWAIAHATQLMEGASMIEVHFSRDNGLSWSRQLVASDPQNAVSAPAMVMTGGIAHIAWYHDYNGVRYAQGKLVAEAAPFDNSVVPFLPGSSSATPYLSMALDANNNPGLAMIGNDDSNGYNRLVGFWRPGTDPVLVTTSNGYQIDDPQIRLAFAGVMPRVLTTLRRDDNYYSDYNHALWLSRSDDGGTTWAEAVNIPSDGSRSLDPSIDHAYGSAGQGALVAESNGGSLDGVQCGEPKLSRSDDLVNWSTCGPAPLGTPNTSAAFPTVRFAGNDKLYVAFLNLAYGDDALPRGVVLWREPF